MSVSRRFFGRQLVIGGAAVGAVATLGGAHDAGAADGISPAFGSPAGIRYKNIHFVFYGDAGEILHRANIGHAYEGIYNKYSYTWTVTSAIHRTLRSRRLAVIEAWSEGKLLMRHANDLILYPHGDINIGWYVDCTERLPIHEWPSHIPQPPPFSPEVA